MEPIDAFTDFSTAALAGAENELSRRYLRLVLRWIPVGMRYFNPWPGRPNCGHFFGGVLWYGQDTCSPIATLALAASSPEYDAEVTNMPRDELRQVALQGLRYLCFTHDTGPEDCVRPSESWGRPEPAGTKWGERGKGFFRESLRLWRQAGDRRGMALSQVWLGWTDGVEGSEGWVQFDFGGLHTHPNSLATSKIGPDEIHLPRSYEGHEKDIRKNYIPDHVRNFLDSVKSRKEPIEPVEVGHRTATICHIGNICLRLNRKLRWNPEKEHFIDDDQANKMMSRPMREPWQI